MADLKEKMSAKKKQENIPEEEVVEDRKCVFVADNLTSCCKQRE